MHQNSARGLVTHTSIAISTGNADTSLAHRLDVVALVGELNRIVQHQNRTLARSKRSRVALKCPARMPSSLTRPLSRNRYAALVFARSRQTRGMLSPEERIAQAVRESA